MDGQTGPRNSETHASECLEKLRNLENRMRGAIQTHKLSSTPKLLARFANDVNDDRRLLQAWITEYAKGSRTESAMNTGDVDRLLGSMSHFIESAGDALHDRLRYRRIYLIGFWPGKREKYQRRLKSALKAVHDYIGELHAQNKFLSTEKADRRSKALKGITDPLEDFTHFFNNARPNEVDDFRRVVLDHLWTRFPRRPKHLEGKIGNPDTQGDGLLYYDQQVKEAKAVLQDLVTAWSKVEGGLGHPSLPRLPDMVKICLVLTGMEQQTLLEPFLDNNVVDEELPMDRERIECILSGEHSHFAAIFYTEQRRAVPHKWDEGAHLILEEEEPLPFEEKGQCMQGSYGSVTKVYNHLSDSLYARKEQRVDLEEEEILAARKHLEEETKRLKQLRHNHVVQLVNSYQRGRAYGILLKPAATCDLEQLMRRFNDNKYDTFRHCKPRDWINPIFLHAFGCLSKGLAHIHDKRIRHKDVKPANILYEEAFKGAPPRLLWADFGLAYDFSETGNSKTRGTKIYSQRYAAPEIVAASTKVKARRKTSHGLDLDIIVEDSAIDEGHGRKTDIFSLGCVYLELLACLIGEKLPTNKMNVKPPDWMFSKHIPELTEWAKRNESSIEGTKLASLLKLAVKMISFDPGDRPLVADVVRDVAAAGDRYFCDVCKEDTNKVPDNKNANGDPMGPPLRASSGNILHRANTEPRRSTPEVLLEKVSAGPIPQIKRVFSFKIGDKTTDRDLPKKPG